MSAGEIDNLHQLDCRKWIKNLVSLKGAEWVRSEIKFEFYRVKKMQ